MGLTTLELDLNLTWVFERLNGVFRATKQGRDSRAWSLAGLDLSVYDQAIVDDVTLTDTNPDLTIDLTDGANLIPEFFALTVVQAIVILARPTDHASEDCAVVFSPGSTNPFRWTFGGNTHNVSIAPYGMYCQSYGIGEVGTNIPGRAVTPTTKNLKLSRQGPDEIDVFYFIAGSTQ